MIRNKLFVYGDERLEVPFHLHFGKDMLDRMADYKDQPALINADDGGSLTFGELAQKTVDIALSLARIGVRKGDVVSVCCEKRIEVIPTILGTICAGAISSPIGNAGASVRLEHLANIVKPKVMFMSAKYFDLYKPKIDAIGCVETYVIYGNENKDGGVLFKHFLTETADVADFVPAPVDGWKDLALILFSSGTTGLPKGVPITHLGTVMNSVSCTNASFKYSSILITREWFSPIGLFITISCLKRGTTCVFTLNYEEKDYLYAIDKFKVRILQAIPSFITQLTKSAILDQYDVTSVEAILTGSMPLGKEQIENVKKRFPSLRDVFQIYGIVETGSACNTLYVSHPKDGSVGTPSHGFIVKVVDIETRKPLGPNQRGEICVKSPTLTPGYTGVDNTDHLDCEGFYKTGDVGYYDEDKHFYVINRIKELIKYKDTLIAPAEIEAILVREPRVREAGVTAGGHLVSADGHLAASGGHLVAALVVLQPGAVATARELLDYLHDHVKSFCLEGGVHFVAALPRGAGDKLDRAALRQMLHQLLYDKTKE